ncbi:hypothetical protein BDN71DRAFT_353526 [Pleurotus eryngii]|uniref:Uncharacterized protein n=1 Tax=Pleurotus eryngii TaxID=5323 RepID=A0A9P6A454_PLEER|nr:hypothetical protein BDN71DRAFT_353526 [Pleurotus eryngii]
MVLRILIWHVFSQRPWPANLHIEIERELTVDVQHPTTNYPSLRAAITWQIIMASNLNINHEHQLDSVNTPQIEDVYKLATDSRPILTNPSLFPRRVWPLDYERDRLLRWVPLIPLSIDRISSRRLIERKGRSISTCTAGINFLISLFAGLSLPEPCCFMPRDHWLCWGESAVVR